MTVSIDASDPRFKLDLYLFVVVKGRRLEVQPLGIYFAGKEFLGQRRPLIREIGFVADQDDAPVKLVEF